MVPMIVSDYVKSCGSGSLAEVIDLPFVGYSLARCTRGGRGILDVVVFPTSEARCSSFYKASQQATIFA